ncbi:hypothetical protein THOG05_400022 [Vibrio rotiferianus]|nr:hypothetical protein THOG05_400022 [Vibrio rotiferianus]CAH1548826.1 hypothetical protein THOE12_10124 [Vibrio rotiferianus]
MDSFAICDVCCTCAGGHESVEKIVNARKHLNSLYLTTAGVLHDSFILVIHKNSG